MPSSTQILERQSIAPHPCTALASEVLIALRKRDNHRPMQPAPVLNPRKVAQLFNAVLSDDFDSASTVRALGLDGMSHVHLSDYYIPAVARRLGSDWEEDLLSFARVTVGAGRLQEMLGWVGHSNDFVASSHRFTPNVLVVCFEGDDHTIGWKLITLQLRRLGVAVQAVLGVSPAGVAGLIGQARYDLVLVSASRTQVQMQIAELLETLRAGSVEIPPLVLGGLVTGLLSPDEFPTEVVALTNSLEAALSHKKSKLDACCPDKK